MSVAENVVAEIASNLHLDEPFILPQHQDPPKTEGEVHVEVYQADHGESVVDDMGRVLFK